jgi:hypothetical protein
MHKDILNNLLNAQKSLSAATTALYRAEKAAEQEYALDEAGGALELKSQVRAVQKKLEQLMNGEEWEDE